MSRPLYEQKTIAPTTYRPFRKSDMPSAELARFMVATCHVFGEFEFWVELNPDRDLRSDVIDFHKFLAFKNRAVGW